MLFDADNTRAVVRALKSHYGGSLPPLVCDPVSISTSGHTLLHPDAIEVMISELLPLTTLITPNKLEAELLLAHTQTPQKIDSLETMLQAASNLLRLGSQAVLLKGGHLVTSFEDVDRFTRSRPDIQVARDGLFEDNMEILRTHGSVLPSRLVVDVLTQKNGTSAVFIRPHIDSTSTHGTGCTLSAALACELAKGSDGQLQVQMCCMQLTVNKSLMLQNLPRNSLIWQLRPLPPLEREMGRSIIFTLSDK
jgi:hydroxymethylpyrimidine/phosphomethylpyrimidine kinase